MKRKAETPARTARALGKSWGFSISEMKVGKRICGTQRNLKEGQYVSNMSMGAVWWSVYVR